MNENDADYQRGKGNKVEHGNSGGKGRFFVLEGIDGSGKSTQARLLTQRLQQMGVACYETREPTDAPVGTLIHQMLTGRVTGDNKTIAALFVADRLDHLLNETNGILKKVQDGMCVVSDRYYFSSYAYHSVDMPMDWVIAANAQSAQLLRPTATLFLDISPERAMERIARNRADLERFETLDRLTRVREQYFKAFEAQKDVENVIVVNGDQDEAALSDEIWAKVQEFFR